MKKKSTPRFMILIVPLILSALTCCDRSINITDKLHKAESFMENYPDSALKILQSIATNELINLSDKALYGLLYTQAIDKNWLDPTNDSIISLAVDYYDGVNDPYRQAMSYYYQGRVLYFNENYPAAILSFFKTKKIAELNGFDFYTALACRGISDIYNKTYNAAEELYFSEKEYDYFRKIRKQPYLNYAILNHARSLYNKGELEKSLNESFQLLDSAKLYEDDILRFETLRLQALNYLAQGKYKDSYHPLIEICKDENADISDSLRLCDVLIEIGQIDNALNLLGMTSDTNPALKGWVQYKIERNSHNYLGALKEFERIDSITNETFRQSVSHNLTTTLTDYFNFKMTENELKIKSERIYRYLSLFIGFIFTVIFVSLFIIYYRKQSKKISEKVLLAEQLSETLRKRDSEQADSSEIMRRLISSKNELLDELCAIVYSNNDENKRRRKVADAVDRVIEDLSTRSDKITQLEKQVDSLHNNLFSNFMTDFPKLKEVDYRLFLFLVLGLEIPTITLLLKENKIEAVYNRKRRLKVKISNLKSEHANKYLSYF